MSKESRVSRKLMQKNLRLRWDSNPVLQLLLVTTLAQGIIVLSWDIIKLSTVWSIDSMKKFQGRPSSHWNVLKEPEQFSKALNSPVLGHSGLWPNQTRPWCCTPCWRMPRRRPCPTTAAPWRCATCVTTATTATAPTDRTASRDRRRWIPARDRSCSSSVWGAR